MSVRKRKGKTQLSGPITAVTVWAVLVLLIGALFSLMALKAEVDLTVLAKCAPVVLGVASLVSGLIAAKGKKGPVLLKGGAVGLLIALVVFGVGIGMFAIAPQQLIRSVLIAFVCTLLGSFVSAIAGR